MTDTLQTIREIFREVFDDDALEVAGETSATDIDGWDSLMHINLMIAFEKVFGIRFATAEIADLKEPERSVSDLVSIIERKVESHG